MGIGCLLSSGADAQKKIVGYYPSWSKSAYPASSIKYQHLTHIAHAFIFPYADGSLDYSGFTLYPELNTAAHQENVNVVISIGGWDDVRTPRFAQMAADTAARKKFVAAVCQFILANNYDGADIDWEYPKNASERSNFALLMHELRLALDATSPGLTLSIAAPATGWSGQWLNVETMKNDLDWIGLMTYDFYGAWTSKAGPNSALYGSFATNSEGWVDYSFSYYHTTRGVGSDKLLIGIPFYGQMFTASSYYGTSTGASQQTYTKIVPKFQQGWTRHWDSEGQIPYLINSTATQVITYDDSQSVAAKCSYVNSKGAGGAIIWAIGQDVVGSAQPLLETVGAGLKSTVYVQEHKTAVVPATASLDQNYPNPFNGATVIRFSLNEGSDITISLFDLLGREVRTVAQGFYNAGLYSVSVSSESLSSGMYVYRMSGNKFLYTRSMIVLR